MVGIPLVIVRNSLKAPQEQLRWEVVISNHVHGECHSVAEAGGTSGSISFNPCSVFIPSGSMDTWISNLLKYSTTWSPSTRVRLPCSSLSPVSGTWDSWRPASLAAKDWGKAGIQHLGLLIVLFSQVSCFIQQRANISSDLHFVTNVEVLLAAVDIPDHFKSPFPI